MQTLIPASEKDRLATHLASITQLEASLRQTYGIDAEHGRLHEAGDAADVRQHQHRQQMMGLVDRVHDRVRRRLLRRPARPTATPTWTSASISSD